MGAFELNSREHEKERDRNRDHDKDRNEAVLGSESSRLDARRLREECIIALKVYDSCRQPHCINYASRRSINENHKKNYTDRW